MAAQTRYDRFRKAYQDLDLFPLLTEAQIAEFRVDYGNRTLANLKAAVNGAPPNGKLIFSGHRGSGKSTLLAKFCEKVSDQYFVVPVSIRDTADMSNVSHVDILFAVCLSLMDKAEAEKVAIPLAVRKALYEWFAKKTRTSTDSVKAEVGGGFNFFKLIFGKLQTEATIRDEIKEEFKPKISDLARKIDEIAGFVRQGTQKEILVVIDELDKLDLELVNDIYKNNVKALFSPALRIIFTIPISVVRDIELKTNLESETGSSIQQMEIANFYS